MKNPILTVFAAIVLMGCKKNETATTADQSADSRIGTASDSSALKVNDSTTIPGSPETAGTLSDQDKKFADAAARGGMMEVMMGELAGRNAANASVKKLGEMMVKDHTKANDELKKWASDMGYTLPAALAADQQKKYEDLKAKNRADFDRSYTELMVSDHKKDIEEFKKQASEGKETSLKTFAGKTLPTLEHHLMESEKTKNAVK
ncbi:MAG: DUF4142 domain-containing protein [Chryseobacterium sp.]|jgi:putative membrane protein|uniref:DUF4142 domain-containing protein n=1 Tax=Chryseobacterium sp. TaxID=1871047 RepID=UPI00281E5E9A|nr:DUF4142 domain-containing protein [Chryseobacterium sp.]MDR2234826.1 DUF4142 domain-containing protein [Chryseobacterium sp.]